MRTLRAVTVAFGIIISLSFAASSVLAEAVHSDKFANPNGIEQRSLHVPEVIAADETSYLFDAAPSNNGRHLGFSIAAFHSGPRLGIVRPNVPEVTQNPEPATMILLGTGLAAVGAVIRRRRRV